MGRHQVAIDCPGMGGVRDLAYGWMDDSMCSNAAGAHALLSKAPCALSQAKYGITGREPARHGGLLRIPVKSLRDMMDITVYPGDYWGGGMLSQKVCLPFLGQLVTSNMMWLDLI